MSSDIPSTQRQLVSIILAGGKSTRMQDPFCNKVCNLLDDKPVIIRAIEQYTRLGIYTNYIVIGADGEQVIQHASKAQGKSIFCRQIEPKGTGNAARTASDIIKTTCYNGDVLVVAGDKVLEGAILMRLMETFYANNSDLAFVVGNADDFPSAGRIVTDINGCILGNFEVSDIARFLFIKEICNRTLEHSISTIEAKMLVSTYFKSDQKASKALASLWKNIQNDEIITHQMLDDFVESSKLKLEVGGIQIDDKLLSDVKYANLSVYMFKATALYESLNRITSDNAQQEEYLTDAIGILAASGCRIDMVPITYREEAMAYNTPDELEAIRAYYASKSKIHSINERTSIRRVCEWINIFNVHGADADHHLRQIYNNDESVFATKRQMIESSLEQFANCFGDQEVVISRAPGRVNIMGRHIDHQGGCGNMIAVDRDTFIIASRRYDRLVNLRNMDSDRFPERIVCIDDLFNEYDGNWLKFINSESVKARLAMSRGDWSHYIIAAILRLQACYPNICICGMNIMVSGNIPIAAGLSSSSTMVVATMEAIAYLNNLSIPPEEFVELCGEAEWYVGTRGGSGDHAAMKFAQKCCVTQVGFFPFRVVDTASFPEQYKFMICNSHIKAQKTDGAGNTFNHRVACYNIGKEIFKRNYPDYASIINHLRDINIVNLSISYTQLLGMLKCLPEMMLRDEVVEYLPQEMAEKYLSTHSSLISTYHIRSVVMYGLSECERSRMCIQLLKDGNLEDFGTWMNTSHDGDRVIRWYGELSNPFTPDYSERAIDKLIMSASSNAPEAQLENQSGSYSCSIPEIDKMVDVALSVDGVLGAQIAGAGLGGCIMALVQEDACKRLEEAMIQHYYEPSTLEPEIFICHPVNGNGLITI
ncbi:MAG: GHMP family kinase ATP-binding protein [Armatimonadota bacterium]